MRTEVVLLIVLRLLAGESHLVVSWPYELEFTTVNSFFLRCLKAIDEALDNTRLPTITAECVAEAFKFRKIRNSPFCEILGAVDEISIAIKAPPVWEVQNPRQYYNRKGFSALCV